MHQALFIQEILLEIFGHCLPAPLDRNCGKADLAALARTCQTFKEPALDILWEELCDLSPLPRCLPEVCKRDNRYYSFSRPLSEAEWGILRGYTRRVRCIRQPLHALDERIVNTLPTFADPLFPNLRWLLLKNCDVLPVVHIAVPSLTWLCLNFRSASTPIPTEFLDAMGERCPNIRQFTFTRRAPLNAVICRQLSRWRYLECVDCRLVTLDRDTILHFSSTPTLKRLLFTLDAETKNHIPHVGSALAFSNLTDLMINSTSLKSITNLFSHIRLPAIKDLGVSVSKYTPKRDVLEYWIAVQRACPSNTLACLSFFSPNTGGENSIGFNEQKRPWLTPNDLLPYKEFGNLREMRINIAWSVKLTDADILDLASTSPRLEALSINRHWGWRMNGGGGGITLSGLVQLLRQCPFLNYVVLAIDAQTFTWVPCELDVSFPHRGTVLLDYLDSNIEPRWIQDLELVFKTLGLDAGSIIFRS